MKVKSSNAHNVNTKQLQKKAFQRTLNQSMKVKSSHALIVTTMYLGDQPSRGILNQCISTMMMTIDVMSFQIASCSEFKSIYMNLTPPANV